MTEEQRNMAAWTLREVAGTLHVTHLQAMRLVEYYPDSEWIKAYAAKRKVEAEAHEAAALFLEAQP